ncbi:serine/threonine-protein kinase Nek10 isoform X2 [Hydra vulgaris]|uniref:serine/threonine-protein kinase Nek10 isoform X2 n=1 Tax=Hydra vulgaris TaxID=6087 RepID=UPI001F5F40DA|nr:serine/threonine-protein kinase Nek10-like isoform X2 [Hydra vulgaris]
MPLDMTKTSTKLVERSSDTRFLDTIIEHFNLKKSDKVELVKGSISVVLKEQYENESKLLKQFWLKFKSEQCFSSKDSERFLQIFRCLLKSCFSKSVCKVPLENIYRTFQCFKLLLRDSCFQNEFVASNGLLQLNEYLKIYSEKHIQFRSDGSSTRILKEIISICQKFASEQSSKMISYGMHQSLVLLLTSTDIAILHLSLYTLLGLTKREDAREAVCAMNSVEILVQITAEYDDSSRHLAVNLLRQLCTEKYAREQVKIFNGIPILLSLLRSDSMKLLWNVVWIIVQLCEDSDISNEIRVLGGIPLLIALLQDPFLQRKDSLSDNTVAGIGGADVSNGENINQDLKSEQKHTLQAAVCAALTELVLNDTNARCVVQANGIYIIMMLIFSTLNDVTNSHGHNETSCENNSSTNFLERSGVSCENSVSTNFLEQNGEKKSVTISQEHKYVSSEHCSINSFDKSLLSGRGSIGNEQLQKNAFRTLRFLFSMERNRQLFKRLFPAELFEKFIDVGHYQRDLNSYNGLVTYVNQLTLMEYQEIRERIQTINLNKAPSFYVQSYAVYEHLGTGAFGSVYKVKRKGGQSYLAMKEISVRHPEFGKGRERSENIDSLINECSFVKKQLNHPNIVKYHKAFLEGDKLYIIMDLIDGAPIGEHFNSLKEKGQRFSEERLWNIFVQMVLALRYIHKEKFIVHRDLTPNNIMLGEDDQVTITDFGLARQKNPEASKLTSMVGTIVYSCPEIVKGLPYGEKADIWGIGCILYQMAMLEPPFFSNNMLSMATKIVDGLYEPLKDGVYSTLVTLVIQRCLTVSAEERPDIIQVAAMIPDILMQRIEKLRNQNINIHKKFEKERKRVQKQTDHLQNHRQTYYEGFSDKSLDNPPSFRDENPSSFRDAQQLKTRPLQIKRIQKAEQRSSESWESMDEDSLKENDSLLEGQRRWHISSNLSHVSNTTVVLDHMKRTNSCSYLDSMKLLEKLPQKFRPTSAQTTLSISPRKVREINDPILLILSQLHKVIFISQLPPSLHYDQNRRIIEQYKRSLFTMRSSATNLKNEIKKLMEGSKEYVDSSFSVLNSMSSHEKTHDNLTYEDLQKIYYWNMVINNMTSSRSASYQI